MVSKVAVIALVAIVACPILLGFGLNLSEQTVTEYKPGNDSVNVTLLLQNGIDYYTTNTDPVTINTSWGNYFLNYGIKVMPIFKTINSNYSSIQLSQFSTFDSAWVPEGWTNPHDFNYYDLRAAYDSSTSSLDMTIHYTDNTSTTIYKILAFNWDGTTETLSYYVSGVGRTVVTDTSSINGLTFNTTGPYLADSVLHYDFKVGAHYYVNLSDGYYVPIENNGYFLHVPDYQNILFTIDLSDISTPNYGVQLDSGHSANRIAMIKTTDVDGIHWALYRVSLGVPTTKITDLYFNQNSTSNTYQIYYDDDKTEFRYVGDWPTLIGPANYYKKYTISPIVSNNLGSEFCFVHVVGDTISRTTPLMRIDWSEYSSTQYSTINNQTYDPATFRDNPSTTINNAADGTPTRYGSSITFGGNTYNVSDGNITMGSHQVSLRGLTFSSYPVAGGYENKIGGVTVSTTPQPSQITFGGVWNVSISTVSMDQNTYVHTEWTPGEFAWDGIDQNFLMIGLLTAFGVFIALGIAYRKTKAALGGLLVVCGGAILLFFTML